MPRVLHRFPRIYVRTVPLGSQFAEFDPSYFDPATPLISSRMFRAVLPTRIPDRELESNMPRVVTNQEGMYIEYGNAREMHLMCTQSRTSRSGKQTWRVCDWCFFLNFIIFQVFISRFSTRWVYYRESCFSSKVNFQFWILSRLFDVFTEELSFEKLDFKKGIFYFWIWWNVYNRFIETSGCFI